MRLDEFLARCLAARKMGLSSAARNIDLAKKYGVTGQTICDIRKRRSWAWL